MFSQCVLYSKVLLAMQSASLVLIPSFPKLPLAIPASYTAARSPNSRVARLAAVSASSNATGKRRFLVPKRNVHSAHSCVRLATDITTINPYEKLNHAERAWTMARRLAFLWILREALAGTELQ